MRVVILAGGRGTRLGGDQPKPMVQIGDKPMLSHIMGIYQKFGYNDFIIATGYKGEMIREYYEGFPNVTCFDTGLDTGTGDRVRMCAEVIKKPFMLTYGDGVADIDIRALTHNHILYNHFGSHGHCVTVTAVHPPARFGQMALDGNVVTNFVEKPKHMDGEWINGGFFVLDSYPPKEHSFEFEFLPNLVKENRLFAYRHTGFWQCMDTQRDVDYLNQLVQEGRAPWL
jgi:glucose-1-phosphate cytidylyltransferase